MPLRDAAAHFAEQTKRQQEGHVPGAYKPVVSLDAADLATITNNIEKWTAGDLDSVDEYIQRTALSIWQTMGVVALKEVKGRNGLNARISAAKGWFDMAKKMKELVKENQDKVKPGSDD